MKLGLLKLTSGILKEIKESKKSYLALIDLLVLINQGKEVDFRIVENDIMHFHDRVYVPNFLEPKKSILEEGHISNLSIHTGYTKMYQNLKKMFWWS